MPEQIIETIKLEELLSKVNEKQEQGFRLVAISCTKREGTELSYSFDKQAEFVTLRLHIGDEDEVESISPVYPYSFLYENEIKELFGVKIKNIQLDFEGALYKTAVKTPFGNQEKEGE